MTICPEILAELHSRYEKPEDLDGENQSRGASRRVVNKAIHLALGVNLEGQKELLGLWVTPTETSKFWLFVLTELKNRGVQDIFIACCDGLTGFSDALEAVFPQTVVQLSIMPLVRNSLNYVSYKDRKAVVADLKLIYIAVTDTEAQQHLTRFATQWDALYPTISRSWKTHWVRIIPFFAFPPDTRKVIYLAIQNIAQKWTMPIRDWNAVLNQFAIAFEARFPT